MEVLRISNLHKRFGEKEVLKGLNLVVPEHSIFGFIGKNGAGKTTAMKTVLGLLKAEEGEIEVLGERVTYGQTSTNRHIGYLPDVPEYYGFMTAREYLNFCGEIVGIGREDREARSQEMLELVGLANEKGRIKGYSRGMKQRLGVAQALLNRPKLLICDEPTSALDPIGRKEILDLFLAVREHTTVLFSTHILSDIERVCTDVAFLNDGKICLSGNISEVKSRYKVDRFLLKMERAEDCLILEENFDGVKKIAEDTLVFRQEGVEVFKLLSFIASNKLSILKIEKEQPTLESAFLEVIEK